MRQQRYAQYNNSSYNMTKKTDKYSKLKIKLTRNGMKFNVVHAKIMGGRMENGHLWKNLKC